MMKHPAHREAVLCLQIYPLCRQADALRLKGEYAAAELLYLRALALTETLCRDDHHRSNARRSTSRRGDDLSQPRRPRTIGQFNQENMMKTLPTKLFHSTICAALLCVSLCLAFASAPVSQAESERCTAPFVPTPLCDNIQVPTGHKVISRLYAKGVQIYRWDGASWVFVAPSADLFADANFHGKVGTHYGGPTWESNSGSKVIGSRVAGCSPNTTAIPWLLLKAVSTKGPGIFGKVTYIQRVNTVGGLAPTLPGSMMDEVAEIPYTTEYYFYRAENRD